MRHREAVEVVANAISASYDAEELTRLILVADGAGGPNERGMAALRLGFIPDPEARKALRRMLDEDADGTVRFMAAQGLLTGQHDPGCLPLVARLVRDQVAIGTRDALDPATMAIEQVALFVEHARLGLVPAPDAEAVTEVQKAGLAALELATRLRSRHRRVLEGWLQTLVATGSRGPQPDERDPVAALIPPDLTDSPLRVSTTTATTWGDRRVNRALRELGCRPSDVAVASAHPDAGPGLMLDLYIIPDRSAEQLAGAFESVFFRPSRKPWDVVDVDGRQVRRQDWAMDGAKGTIAWWTRDELVIRVIGDDLDVMRAIKRLP